MGLKALRSKFAERTCTPPTPGSQTQKRKANRNEHRNGPHSRPVKGARRTK